MYHHPHTNTRHVSLRKTAPWIGVEDAPLHNPTKGEQLFAQVQNSRARAFAQNLSGAPTGHIHTAPTLRPHGTHMTCTRPSDKPLGSLEARPTGKCASGAYGRRSAKSYACWSDRRSARASQESLAGALADILCEETKRTHRTHHRPRGAAMYRYGQ